KIQREGGQTLNELIVDIHTVADQLAEAGADGLAENLRRQLSALSEARDFLLREEPVETLPAAVPFLNLMGVVCSSWQLSRLWLAAGKACHREAFEAGWLDGLRTTVEFYMSTWGPQAQACCDTVVSSGKPLICFDEQYF
ncbi:MAG: acyl-CoA dehydrogenase C-terminal domain-containing protein, partial [Gammaproteobacteria bacterium]|nr:acyl-CoA dehydrogenase C-terminal domain-containing protein [Gammaproteobacteria bacterium]